MNDFLAVILFHFDPCYNLFFLLQQDDAVSYINDALKNGAEISCFRKDKIGGDGNATSYW